MQARYYDPVIGRFYSNDPVDVMEHMQRGNSAAHGFGRYTYANNNPYKYVDPDGEFSYFPGYAEYQSQGQRVIDASSVQISLGGLGLKGGYKSPSSLLEVELGATITPSAKLDKEGLKVQVAVEAAFEATTADGASTKAQIGKFNVSTTDGKVTTTKEGPNLEVSPKPSGTLQADGVLKINAKVGPVRVEYELDGRQL
jgi:RHS repeat-associated protein